MATKNLIALFKRDKEKDLKTNLKNFISLCFGMVMYDNEIKTKGNKIQTRDKIEPQQLYQCVTLCLTCNIFLFVTFLFIDRIVFSCIIYGTRICLFP